MCWFLLVALLWDMQTSAGQVAEEVHAICVAVHVYREDSHEILLGCDARNYNDR